MPTPYKVTLAPNRPALGYHEIQVDGRDISRGVGSVRLDLEPGHLPRIELELHVVEVDVLEVETTQLYIPDATRDALIALGWTPPA